MGIRAIFKPIGWVFSKFWWLLDGTRRAILNLLLLALLIGIAVALVNRGPKPLQDKTTLVLSLNGNLVEQYSGSAREQAMAQLRGTGTPKQTRLRDVLQTLDAAATDDKIWALMLDLDDFGSAGWPACARCRPGWRASRPAASRSWSTAMATASAATSSPPKRTRFICTRWVR